MHFCSASISLYGDTQSVQEVFVSPLQFLQLSWHYKHSAMFEVSLNCYKKPSGHILRYISLISTIEERVNGVDGVKREFITLSLNAVYVLLSSSKRQ
jgi:hypothetical protein